MLATAAFRYSLSILSKVFAMWAFVLRRLSRLFSIGSCCPSKADLVGDLCPGGFFGEASVWGLLSVGLMVDIHFTKVTLRLKAPGD